MGDASLRVAFQVILSASERDILLYRDVAILVSDKLKPALVLSDLTSVSTDELPLQQPTAPSRNESAKNSPTTTGKHGPDLATNQGQTQNNLLLELSKSIKKGLRKIQKLRRLSITQALEPPTISTAGDFRERDLQTKVEQGTLQFRQGLARRSLAQEYCRYLKRFHSIDPVEKIIANHKNSYEQTGHLKAFVESKSFARGTDVHIRAGIKMLIIERYSGNAALSLAITFSYDLFRRVKYELLANVSQDLQGMSDSPWNTAECQKWFHDCFLVYERGIEILPPTAIRRKRRKRSFNASLETTGDEASGNADSHTRASLISMTDTVRLTPGISSAGTSLASLPSGAVNLPLHQEDPATRPRPQDPELDPVDQFSLSVFEDYSAQFCDVQFDDLLYGKEIQYEDTNYLGSCYISSEEMLEHASV